MADGTREMHGTLGLFRCRGLGRASRAGMPDLGFPDGVEHVDDGGNQKASGACRIAAMALPRVGLGSFGMAIGHTTASSARTAWSYAPPPTGLKPQSLAHAAPRCAAPLVGPDT